MRIFFESISIVGVNVFVLISGWFGIRTNVKGVCKYLFQCFFILSSVYVLAVAFGLDTIGILTIANNVFLLETGGPGWFVIAYLFLLVLAPILNAYCTTATGKQLLYTVIGFYFFQTLFGTVTLSTAYIGLGYSPLSFIGLYLLARYVNLYARKVERYATYAYLITLVCITIILYASIRFSIDRLLYLTMSYVSPLVIINALSLLLIFGRQKPRYNKAVNFIAASSFSVYLVHNCNSAVIAYFKLICNHIYDGYSGVIYLAVILAFLIGVYIIAILLDRIRIFVWNKLCLRNLISLPEIWT